MSSRLPVVFPGSQSMSFCRTGEAVKAHLCGMEDQVNKCPFVLSCVSLLSLSCPIKRYCCF